MPKPTADSGCPPGLKYLLPLDQKIDYLEALTRVEQANKFVIQESRGQQIFYTAEEPSTAVLLRHGHGGGPARSQSRGKVRQIHSCCMVKYVIEGKEGDTVLYLTGPRYCNCPCPGLKSRSRALKLMKSKDDNQVIGFIAKKWTNLMQEYFTLADNFGISFPKDLHLDTKATIIGACFLIDFMYFEVNRAACMCHTC
uniref:Phospholipid scramblase n=1 Tax=Macrostomum lignano TaxID=282301 RepID=A0A1I8IF79_9PLAT